MSSAELETLIQLGENLLKNKNYSIAVCTILFYDYFLTLGDEVKYIWNREKQWTFWLFLANRYFPMTYQFLYVSLGYSSYFNVTACHRIAWYFVFVLVTCTLLAQVVLTLRVWAVTVKNLRIVAGFMVITTAQFVFGFVAVIIIGRQGAQVLPPIPLDAFRLCIFTHHRTLEIVFTSLSLLFDFLAFSVIMFYATRSKRRSAGLKVQTLLGTVAEDATVYFLVIFTAHVVLQMTLIFGAPAIQLLPGPGIVVYLPVMISRIMLSLKKAAEAQQQSRPIGEPSSHAVHSAMVFRPRGTNSRDGNEIPLGSYSETSTTPLRG